ncbi:MAG: hypothetical protein ABW045_11445 [Gaiellaceae bacterium]
MLGSDGLFPVAATGPTFWFGGTVTDPTSLFGQAFYELQFYPDSIVTNCNPNGAFVVKFAPNTYSACSPVWSVHQTGTKVCSTSRRRSTRCSPTAARRAR